MDKEEYVKVLRGKYKEMLNPQEVRVEIDIREMGLAAISILEDEIKKRDEQIIELKKQIEQLNKENEKLSIMLNYESLRNESRDNKIVELQKQLENKDV